MTDGTDITAVRTEVDRILAAGLDELTEHGRSAVKPGPEVDGWRLPAAGCEALRAWGLPAARGDDVVTGIVGSFQTDAEPEVRTDGFPGYLLGHYGVGCVCVVAGSGEVFYVPRYAEVHPQLAHLHPDGPQPTMVTSSVEFLVELAWRWHRLLPVLAEAEQAAGKAEVAAYRAGARGDDVPDFYAPYQELCGHVYRRFHETDPAVTDGGFWHSAVNTVW